MFCLLNLELILLETLEEIGTQVAEALGVERSAVLVQVEQEGELLCPRIAVDAEQVAKFGSEELVKAAIAGIYRGGKMVLNDRRVSLMQVRADATK